MDLSLIETLRWEPDSGFIRLERHLARLAGSAETLGLPGAGYARDTLVSAVPPGTETPLRMRLELFSDGRIAAQVAPFTPLSPDTIWRLRIASGRLASSDPYLRHKTSRRSAYAAARAEFPATDADEVLLLNERGEVCEGTITSLFLDDATGPLKTPPLASGLLAGILREELIETGQAVEQVLFPDDLLKGRLFVGNSLRGLISGRLA